MVEGDVLSVFYFVVVVVIVGGEIEINGVGVVFV